MRRACPECGSTSVVIFDADEDWCTQCKSRFPGESFRDDRDGELTQLRAELVKAGQERDELAARFWAVKSRARLTFELNTMEVLLAENASAGARRLSQIIVAWDEADRRAEAAEQERDTLKAECERLAGDAARWRAIINCARVRVLGSAGIHQPNEKGYAHIGLELWTHHHAGSEPVALEWLAKFADIAIRAESSTLPRTYEQGAEDMRERAGQLAHDLWCEGKRPWDIWQAIRALPAKELGDE